MPDVTAAPPAPPRFTSAGTTVATVVVIVASAISVALDDRAYLPPAAIAVIGALLIGSTLGLTWIERVGSGRTTRLLVAALCALGTVAIASTDARASLVVMPLISFAVLYGSTRWGVALTTLYTLEAGAMVARSGHPASVVFQAGAAFATSGVFVVVFSRLMRRERIARTNVERLVSELEAANARLREYATQAEDLATTKERNRVAREIHDSLGHFLTVVHVQLEAARTHLDSAPQLSRECLSRARRLTEEGLADVRRSVALLRTSPMEARPLRQGVSELVGEFRTSGVEGDLVVSGSPRPLAQAVEFALYRATQEALTNVRRHARASRVAIELTYEAALVRLSIRDDGVGATETDGGFGLLGLRERVQLVGGAVEVRTGAGQGFAIEVRVPT
jgi:signal transduction histidine kinase